MSFNMASSYDASHKWHRPAQGLLTIFSWWEKVKNRGEDGPKKSGSGRAGGHLHSRRLLQIAIGLVLTPVMIGCLCRGRVGLGALTETSGKYRLGMSHIPLSATHAHWGSLSCQPCWSSCGECWCSGWWRWSGCCPHHSGVVSSWLGSPAAPYERGKKKHFLKQLWLIKLLNCF